MVQYLPILAMIVLVASASLVASGPGLTQPAPAPNPQDFTPGELVNAGHRFFGTVSRGLATVIEKAVSQWGQPNGYVLGEEAGGAFFGAVMLLFTGGCAQETAKAPLPVTPPEDRASAPVIRRPLPETPIPTPPETPPGILVPAPAPAIVLPANAQYVCVTEAAGQLYLAALVEIGLVLFIVTLVVNGLSRLLIWSMARSGTRSRAAAAASPAESAA